MELPEVRVAWLEQLVGGLGQQGAARAVFGEPIDREGVTVIPVGKMRYGAGGGGGSEAKKDESQVSSGGGGGGGMMVLPTGFIEIKDGKATFRRILDAIGIMQISIGIGLGLWMSLRGLRALRTVQGARG